MKELTSKIKQVYELQQDLYKNFKVYDVRQYSDGLRAALMAKDFFATFTEYQVVEREGTKSDYEVKSGIDGIIFYTLLSQKEYQKYILKEAK